MLSLSCFDFSADQARSLSSYMHNADDYFQYFALDFSPANGGHSAFHGSDILAQASIVNEALKKIRDLYSNAGSTISKSLSSWIVGSQKACCRSHIKALPLLARRDFLTFALLVCD